MSSIEHKMSKKRTRALFRQVLSAILKKPEKLTVSEWAEKYRMLDESSNFSGHWTNDITPYLVGIMDAFNDPYVQEINFVKPTQVGGTEAFLNMFGWVVMMDPSPTMVVYPSDDMAKDISTEKIQPAIRNTPETKERFCENSSKELKLKFRGMTTYIRGSNSPAKLASFAIKYLFFDEIDKIGGASKKEASPYELAKERTKTFQYSKKIYTASTPTLRTNYVWMIHEKADEQRNFFVPCPHCGEYIVFRFAQIVFPEGETIEERAKEATYVCQECGCMITDRDKIKMLRLGEWRSVKKTCIGRPRKVSFWLNALYSRFLTWKDIVEKFLTTKDDPEEFQNFVNSWLAEPWEDTKLKTSAELVMERQTETERFVVPEWTKLITAGVDVQETSLYYSIRAWGDHLTSQTIDHGQVFSFQEIENVMNLEYEDEIGGKHIVNLCLIDSGYNSDATYDFCADNSDWAKPVKGSSNPMQSHYKISKVNKSTSKAYGMDLVITDGGKYKDMIAARMRKNNGSGSWMVYKGCDEEYAKQVTAEHKVRGREKKDLVWVPKTSHADNHYLDTEVYAMAAADILGARSMHLQNEEIAPVQRQEEPEEETWIRNNDQWM